MTSYLFAPFAAAGGWINIFWIILILIVLILCFVLAFWLESRKKSAAKAAAKPEVKAESKPEPKPAPRPELKQEMEQKSGTILRPASEPQKPDDLTILEGVGPKIQKMLNAAGIFTFAQLAGTSVEKLKKVMEDANLRIADPTSWPEQARLAAAGDMAALKAYQDTLKGGRVVK